ncbi:hypothetical protein DSY3557 [Desulfitobacterium hafniense Y51]|uniref:Uncharacterized protein n=1 Tax=Desulfitobacterium hafniense (strain Y51) TaxID=138119 RepID=Q24RJ6_DESHY|nr:hypothetical protein DSY3557 [Desulfitobacterium hafniense Y51]
MFSTMITKPITLSLSRILQPRKRCGKKSNEPKTGLSSFNNCAYISSLLNFHQVIKYQMAIREQYSPCLFIFRSGIASGKNLPAYIVNEDRIAHDL